MEKIFENNSIRPYMRIYGLLIINKKTKIFTFKQ